MPVFGPKQRSPSKMQELQHNGSVRDRIWTSLPVFAVSSF